MKYDLTPLENLVRDEDFRALAMQLAAIQLESDSYIFMNIIEALQHTYAEEFGGKTHWIREAFGDASDGDTASNHIAESDFLSRLDEAAENNLDLSAFQW